MTIDRRLFQRIASILWLPALLLVAAGITTANGIPAQETGLNPLGAASELNRDEQGDLWISDYGANQIWHVTPATGVYTIYQHMMNATDARRDAAGMVWWIDSNSNNLGRMLPSAGTVTTWTLPAIAISPMAIAFGEAGQVWITDYYSVYRFRPGTGEVCTYPVPDGGYSVSIAAQAGNIWLGDGQRNRILNLDPASNLFTLWQLAAGAFPRGLTLDESGNLWWADENLGALARLEPGPNRLTAYTLPDGASPKMIAPNAGKVWYTSYSSGTVGVLDPTQASGAIYTPTKTTRPVTPTCNDLGPGISSTVTLSAGILAWTPDVYTRTVDSGGWTVYQMPAGGYPRGLAAAGKDIWVVDQGRQKLAWLSDLVHIYLPLVMR